MQIANTATTVQSIINERNTIGIVSHNTSTFGEFNIGSTVSERTTSQPSEVTALSLSNLAEQADQSQAQVETSQLLSTTVLATSTTLTSSFSVGYVLWLLRGGTLLASVMASLPAWRAVDPLPVLGTLTGDDDGDTETLESMVEESQDDEPEKNESTSHK